MSISCSVERCRGNKASRKFSPVIVGCVLAIVIFAAMACTRAVPVAPVVTADSVLGDDAVTLNAQASVLITDEDAEFINGIKSVEILPHQIVLDPTDTLTLSARPLDSSGQHIADVDLIWSVADPRAGNIDKDGLFSAGVTPGVFEDAVILTVVQNTPSGIEYLHETSTVTIVGEAQLSRLASVAILPGNPAVLTGQIYRMRAVGFDEHGLVISGVSFTWNVAEAQLGHINELGYLTVQGSAGGYTRAVSVTGIWDGVTISTTVDVDVVKIPEEDDFLRVEILPKNFHVDIGDNIALRAFVFNGVGEIVSGAQFRWTIEDERAGTISGAGVFFPGGTPGVFTESIKVEAIVLGTDGISRASDFASVVVNKVKQVNRLDSIQVIPVSVRIGNGGRLLVIAQASDEFGQPAQNVTVSWDAVDEQVGTIDDDGMFVASTFPGTYPDALRVTMRQLVGDKTVSKSRSVDVTITGTLTEVHIQPDVATIAPGRTVHFSAVGRDENGEKLVGLVTLWRVTDEQIGTIDAFGNFTAGSYPGLFDGAITAEIIQRLLIR